MTTHRLKVFAKYADAIMSGAKTFEIRRNDRGYEVGDKIVFDVVTNEGYAVGAAARHPLNGATYRIDYILDDFEGLAQKYVALAYPRRANERAEAEAMPVLWRLGELYKVWSGYSVKCCGKERCHLQAVPFPAYTTKERAIGAWNMRAK